MSAHIFTRSTPPACPGRYGWYGSTRPIALIWASATMPTTCSVSTASGRPGADQRPSNRIAARPEVAGGRCRESHRPRPRPSARLVHLREAASANDRQAESREVVVAHSGRLAQPDDVLAFIRQPNQPRRSAEHSVRTHRKATGRRFCATVDIHACRCLRSQPNMASTNSSAIPSRLATAAAIWSMSSATMPAG
jgi:hypothetical protein